MLLSRSQSLWRRAVTSSCGRPSATLRYPSTPPHITPTTTRARARARAPAYPLVTSRPLSTTTPRGSAIADKSESPFLPSDEQPQSVAVVGAGLTGLSTAYYLAKHLPESSRITVYEASERVGGLVETFRPKTNEDDGDGDDSVFFNCGPKTVRSLSANGFRADDYVLFDLMDDLPLEYAACGPKRKFLLHDGRVLTVPPTSVEHLQNTTFYDGLDRALLHAFWRYLWDCRRFDARRPLLQRPDVSLGQWLRDTQLDGSPIDKALSAMIGGIYGGDMEKISFQSALPEMYYAFYLRPRDAQHKLMPDADYHLMRELGPDQAAKIRFHANIESISFRHGTEILPQTLYEALQAQPNVDIRLNTPVAGVGYDTATNQATVILPSTSSPPSPNQDGICLYESAEGAEGADGVDAYDKVVVAGKVAGIDVPTAPIYNVSFHFDEEDLLGGPLRDALGFLVPRSEEVSEPALGVFFDSNMDGSEAGTKVSVLLGGPRLAGSSLSLDPAQAGGERHDTALLEERAQEAALTFLRKTLGIRARPTAARARFYPRAIPQHPPGHRENMAHLHTILDSSYRGRVSVAGGHYTAIGVLPALRAGYDAAHALVRGPATPLTQHVGTTGLAQFAASPHCVPLRQVPRSEYERYGKVLAPPVKERIRKLLAKMFS